MSQVRDFLKALKGDPDLMARARACDGADWVQQLVGVAREAGFELSAADIESRVDKFAGAVPGFTEWFGRQDVEPADAPYA
ncbi:MAG: Nif11 family protein [Propionibacteriaceae bacterium]|jgi:predicted ribosomally synthesized peptide with nif11-like leader|nr:Nif11 family protein [Propionibacteriaceae bacterium]